MPSADKRKLDSIEIIDIDLNTAAGTEKITDADTSIPVSYTHLGCGAEESLEISRLHVGRCVGQ